MKFFTFFIISALFAVNIFAYPINGRMKSFRPLVILDAGHGGWDHGAKIKYPFCIEKSMALTTAHYTKRYLEKMGYRVSLTRSRDFYISLPKRVDFANSHKSDVFVSINFNSCLNNTAHGIEAFYHNNQDNRIKSVASKKLAEHILKKSSQKTNFFSRGIKKGNFFVIRETKMPAILLEGGFLTNPQERNCLRQRIYIDKLAKGIAEGIDSFIKT